ncbi:SMI1/KNR4 family protein [Streptomyces paludis]|uniref:SMI1/KNR4 family protein n=1 Tax=Streptomyces paludis TaxID=2282738 RepID=A0A345HLA3_9ACTN|nr:SMI1/KNR4 family protein [Streptomyces paludis]AXG77477.1 SMI1/KNR4 family protein [Streptomyces paludis]
MKTYNWRPFLERWSEDWARSPVAREESPGTWLGFPAAGEERIGALEARLGVPLPPTYRSFLATTDGWRPAGSRIPLLGPADGVRPYAEGVEGTGGGEWGSAVRLSGESAESTDVIALLDPGEVNADGEWAAYLHHGPGSPAPERYETFMELMQALFREFHRSHRDTPGFVTETTRELDADVEDARVACLEGAEADGPLGLLVAASESGRARAHGLRAQVEALLSGGDVGGGNWVGGSWAAGSPDDPLYARELLPLAAWWRLRAGRADGGGDGGGDGEAPAVLREIRERTFRYEAPGAFGVAVVAAREQARRGATDAAWHTLAAALADWEPYGPEQLAPVGLLADPLLGPVITPERGRYVLETPRGEGRYVNGLVEDEGAYDGGEGGRADGLSWLVDDARERHPYRFVLVRDIPPSELAGRIGGPGAALLAPADAREAREAGALARIGACGTRAAGEEASGWSFAFDVDNVTGEPGGFGDAVSRGTAAVTVWCDQGDGGSDDGGGTFHFSYEEDGRRVYGFTVRGNGIERWGPLPEGLDPLDLFPGAEPTEAPDAALDPADPLDPGSAPDPGDPLDPDDEFEALDAVAEEFGVSLPRFAIERGRLHAVAGEPA